MSDQPSRPQPQVILGVGGGIAAYKACEILRGLTESGSSVRVIPTEASLHFVGAATWAALSGQPVSTQVWDSVEEVPHVRLGQQADLVLVAPATADLLARAATGRADDLLTSTLLTARCPVVFVPAMHTEMWEHPATVENVATLRRRGAVVIEPAVGRLTGADSGKGRLPDPAVIVALARQILRRGAGAPTDDLAGRRVVISAGGTREHLDPVRFLGNSSSGRQGYALATTAVARGAEVTLVSANVGLPDPAGAKVVRVVSAKELHAAVLAESTDCDAIVMAAAVADFRPENRAAYKIKKDAVGGVPEPVVLVRNPDVLAELVRRRSAERTADRLLLGRSPVIVGFAAETGDDRVDALGHGREKLRRKGCDLLVVNEVGDGRGFETLDNSGVVLSSEGLSVEIPHGPKEALADVVWDLVAARWAGILEPSVDPG